MNSPHDTSSGQAGFSLIEVIVIIVVFSIAYTIMVTYFGSSYQDSALPVRRLSQSMALKETAERITAYYQQDPAADLNGLKDSLDASPTDFGQDFSVDYNGFVKFSSQNDTAISGGDTEDLLKVRIRHDATNETITLLFSRQ